MDAGRGLSKIRQDPVVAPLWQLYQKTLQRGAAIVAEGARLAAASGVAPVPPHVLGRLRTW